jgi:tRNA(fMet)-specific endonuclease VapC
MIAAQALALDLPLVTNNLKEFSRVPKLKLENWV